MTVRSGFLPGSIRSSGPLATLGRLALGRLVQALLVALVIGIVSFAMMEALPGDAAYRIAAGRYGYDMLTGAAAEQVRIELGLDRPAWQRIADWVGHILMLDLGRSAVTGDPVAHALSHQLGHSIALAVGALLFALVIAVPTGTLAGLRPGGAFDRILGGLTVVFRALPAFLLGIILMLFFAVQLGILPAAGHGHGGHLLLPSLTLGIVLATVLSRVVRNAVAETVASEAFQFARHKGLSMGTALRRHGARNAAVPVVAYLGVQAALLVEGVVVVESIFAWPGIGHALTHAIFERDVPMLQGTALMLGLGFVLLSFTVEVICLALDPRRRA